MRVALSLTLALLIGGLGLVAAQEKKEAKFDEAKLTGKWTYMSAVKNGEKIPEDRLKTQKVTIDKNTWTLEGDQKFVMEAKLDTSKTPVTVKMTIKESPFGAGATADGIIELNGDELKFCYAPMGGAAPTKFEAKEGSNHHLMVLKRAK